MTFDKWLDENYDRMLGLWTEHIEYMQDSIWYRAYLAASEPCWREFCEEQFEKEMSEVEQ